MKHEDKTYNWLDKIILPIILIIIWYILADVLMILPSYTFPGPVEVFNSFHVHRFLPELFPYY